MRAVVSAVCFLAALTYPARGDEESARKASHHFRDAYWQCLALETKHNFSRNLSGTDFELFIRGTCKGEAQRFRVAMIDYLALKFPQIPPAMHFSSADTAIKAAIDDVVSGYIELKNPRR